MKNLVFISFIAFFMLFIACSKDDENNNNGEITDANGNSYKTVIIGDLEWFSENLRATKTKEGVEIPLITDDEAWSSATTSAYTYVDNIESNVSTYGLLYNGYITSLDGLCPEGWRVAHTGDMLNLQNTLEDLYGNPEKVMKDMESGLWKYDSDFDYFNGHNNASGFSGLPSGHRRSTGSFTGEGWGTGFWAGNHSTVNTRSRLLLDTNGFNINTSLVKTGYCIRCVRDVE